MKAKDKSRRSERFRSLMRSARGNREWCSRLPARSCGRSRLRVPALTGSYGFSETQLFGGRGRAMSLRCFKFECDGKMLRSASPPSNRRRIPMRPRRRCRLCMPLHVHPEPRWPPELYRADSRARRQAVSTPGSNLLPGFTSVTSICCFESLCLLLWWDPCTPNFRV